jgi:DNA-binding transcriptional MerR regulator
MATINDFKQAYDVQPNTIRQWSKTFEDFLTPGANPPKGETRRYSDDDGQVLALVAAMRKDHKPYEAIRAALADGDRGQWPLESDQAKQDDAGSSDASGPGTQLITQLTAAASRWEATAHTLADERDYLRDELEAERAARLDAEKRAAIAETKNQAASIMGDVNQRKGSAWGRFKDWIAGESGG